MSKILKISMLFLAVLLLAGCFKAVPMVRLERQEFGMELTKPAYGISALAVSRDGNYAITCDNHSTLRLWDISTGRQVRIMKEDFRVALSLDFSPDGRHALFAGAATGLLRLPSAGMFKVREWDLETGKRSNLASSIPGSTLSGRGVIAKALYSRDGKHILALAIGTDAIGLMDHFVLHIFNAQTGEKVKESPLGKGLSFYCVAAISPDDRYLIIGNDKDQRLRLWDIESGKLARTFESHQGKGRFRWVTFSPDGRYVLSSTDGDEYVRLWEVDTGREVRRFGGFQKLMGLLYYHSLSFSPDGRSAIILSVPSRIVDIASGDTIKELMGTSEVRGVSKYAFATIPQPGWAVFNPNGRNILTTTAEASVRVFDAATGREIAVFVGFEDGEWIFITSEGYYNASEKGAEYLNVVVGDRKYDMNLFYDVFYRPDIVAAKLRGQDIKDLITITMRDAIKSPPPSIEFTSIPSDTDKSKVKACYRAKSTGGGIGEVRLFHNGKLVESDGYYREASKGTEKRGLSALSSKAIYQDMRSVKIVKTKEETIETGTTVSKSKGEDFNDCKEIEAISGENEISITAFNKDNTVQGYMKTAKFNAKIRGEEPHLYIFSIGIDRYKDNTVNLKYAVKDAVDIKEKIIKQAETLYKPQNIHSETLLDSNATKTNIISKISELSKLIRPTDSFILFAAGHGVLLQNQYYLITHEYDGKVAEQTMISSNEIVEMSKKIKSLNQLLVFDTCHAGGVDYIVSGLYDARMSVLAKKMGLHMYASANSKEAAMDGYQGNGLFTYTLLDGLNNKKEADKNKDSKISLVELGEHTKQKTTEISKKIGHQQTPLIINFGKDNPIYQLK